MINRNKYSEWENSFIYFSTYSAKIYSALIMFYAQCYVHRKKITKQFHFESSA